MLAQLYRDYAAGISVRKPVDDLNRRGIRTFIGKPFTSGDLHAILDSGFGLDYVRYPYPSCPTRSSRTMTAAQRGSE